MVQPVPCGGTCSTVGPGTIDHCLRRCYKNVGYSVFVGSEDVVTTIEPDLQFSVLCDDIRREDNGKLIFIGLFEGILAPSFPCTHPRLCIANRWCNGAGEFTQQTKVLTPDDDVLIEDQVTRFRLEDISVNHTVISVFEVGRFPMPGKYSVEVLLDGDLRQRYPLTVSCMGGDGPAP